MVEKLITAGVDMFRLNFSHGTHAEQGQAIRTIRQACRKLDRHVAILADLQGPKIRTGKTPDNRTITLASDSRVILTSRPSACTEESIYVKYRRLAQELTPGQHVLINDGAIRLEVLSVDVAAARVETRVLNTGTYSSHKGVNFPHAALSVPALTAKDKKDLSFILGQDINYIALSFVRRANDLRQLNRRIRSSGRHMKAIAKIEKPEALEHLEEILEECDGLMVARGDLGVETSPYRVPILQKDFIAAANRRGKLVIVATQMLESMTQQPMPTRAESTDVANAVLDGTDALMLSGETAVGAYPVETVTTMARIASETENSPYYRSEFVDLSIRQRHPPHAVCEAAERASRDLGGAPVLVFTYSGDTAFYLSKIRNASPIYAFTPSPRVADALSLAWNLRPFAIPVAQNAVSMIRSGERLLQKRRIVKKGDLVVVVSGTTPVRGATNVLRIKRIGEE
jgi:pyruvate kinase